MSKKKKDMTKEEFDKIMKKIMDNGLATIQMPSFSTSMVSGSSSNPKFPPSSTAMNISPTDKDAKGVYEYQEPEVDEQGTYYGYKVLHKCTNSGCREHGGLISPRYQAHWNENGELQADMTPSEKTMFGIHFTKRENHPELRQYMGRFHGAAYSSSWYESSMADSVLVRCALSGTIVETEQGFRAEHAQIVGVYSNGNWQSYQDYQECTRAYTRPNPIYEDEENGEWNVIPWLTYGKPPKGTGTIYPNPSSDS